jgi:hypothetical protein
MPAAIRSFAGHFAPHVALTLFLFAVVTLVPTFFTNGIRPGVAVPTWRVGIVITAIVMIGFVTYSVLRYYHDRRQCSRCDRNGATDRYRLAPMGFLAQHWHWCRSTPGIWIYLVAWLATMLLSMVSSIGTVLIYAGMALWAASTIAHQARVRSCPSHTSTIMYDPPAKWFSAERVLAELHYRARGADQLHLKCGRYACDEATTVGSPEEAVIWTLGHSDVHFFMPLHSPMVVLQVTLDPHLELEDLHV